jgi:hypothetical protein
VNFSWLTIERKVLDASTVLNFEVSKKSKILEPLKNPKMPSVQRVGAYFSELVCKHSNCVAAFWVHSLPSAVGKECLRLEQNKIKTAFPLF